MRDGIWRLISCPDLQWLLSRGGHLRDRISQERDNPKLPGLRIRPALLLVSLVVYVRLAARVILIQDTGKFATSGGKMATSVYRVSIRCGLSGANLESSVKSHNVEDGYCLRIAKKRGRRLVVANDGVNIVCKSSLSSLRSLQQSRVSTRRSSEPATRFQAIADRVAAPEASPAGNSEESALLTEAEADKEVPYSWETEWYPLYLMKQIPRDGPLALTVFDRPLVLFCDGDGALNCLEDRCPHRLAKLSEGQVIDGKLECLYHGWQFQGDGKCVTLPQLAVGSTIPQRACVRSYAVRESQGVLWVWMADKDSADLSKLPWFEHFARENFVDYSTIHEMPYDYTILLENLLDPAHIPISHNRTDPKAKREDAQPLNFELKESTDRGFSGIYWKSRGDTVKTSLRFDSPCAIRNDIQMPRSTNGKPPSSTPDASTLTDYFSALFLCRPAGQGKSMLIARFGATNLKMRNPLIAIFPEWLIHLNSCSVLEEDMGFLSSQNEVLIKENAPTKDLYLNLRSQDTFVMELRKWLDKVGHGLPYYWGHRTVSPAKSSALEENAPAGMLAYASRAYPSKGAIGTMFLRDPTNRYFRHIVHCSQCRNALNRLKTAQTTALALAAFCTGLALAFFPQNNFWRIALVALAALACGLYLACKRMISTMTQNRLRPHRYS